MRGISSALNRVLGLGVVMLSLLLFPGCQINPDKHTRRQFQTQQQWQLTVGEEVAGYPIVAGLGDISLDLGGATVHAPFDGQLQRAPIDRCFVFSSPEVPAYLFRLCGLNHAKLGHYQLGQALGRGKYLHFAALRQQPDGTWALVEPSSHILERILGKS